MPEFVFTGVEDLSPCEQRTLDAVCGGKGHALNVMRPTQPEPRYRMRAEFVSWLICGKNQQYRPSQTGVRLYGAWIDGRINLRAWEIKWPIELENCWITEEIDFRDANLLTVSLKGSRARGVDGDLVKIRGVLCLADGFRCDGLMRLSGSEIGGALNCSGSNFINGRANAIEIFRAVLNGDCFLSGRYDYLQQRLQAFYSIGGVYLTGTKLRGSLYCSNGNFRVPGPNGDAPERDALNLAGVEIGDKLDLKGVYWMIGRLDLSGSTIDKLCDDVDLARFALRPPEAAPRLGLFQRLAVRLRNRFGRPDRTQNNIVLDGCVYRRLAAPADFAHRKSILDHQIAAHLESDFRSQPWEQIAKVLREMGYLECATKITVTKQTYLRRSGELGPFRFFHWLFGLFIGYGYRPIRATVIIFLVWVFYWLLYQNAYNHGVIVDAKDLLKTDPGVLDCDPTASNPTIGCSSQRSDVSAFSAPMFAADFLFPFVDFRQGKDWAPAVIVPQKVELGAKGRRKLSQFARSKYGEEIRRAIWSEIVIGWLATALFAAVVARLIKKD